MTAKDLNDLSSKLQKQMAKLGRENGTAPLPSQDPLDKILHEYYVDKMAEAFYKKRAEESLKAVLNELEQHHIDEIGKCIKRTLKNDAGEKYMISAAQNFTFNLETRKASTNFSKDKMVIYLTKQGWSAVNVQKLISECSEKAKPACSYRAVPKSE